MRTLQRGTSVLHPSVPGDFMALQINRAAIAKTWLHSHEEDEGDVQVFREAGFSFPPARGRDTLALATDGTLHRSVPGTDDRSFRAPSGTGRVDCRHLILPQPGDETE